MKIIEVQQLIIHGVTEEGQRFRPSDWAERLAGVMSHFRPGGNVGPGNHITYSPYVVPNNIDGVKCVIVDFRLRELEPLAEWILVEGAGGWYTPLSETQTYADWVEAEQLPVILVVGVKLGCINHAMLTADAVRARGLRLAGWIANTVQPPGRRYQEYLTALTQRLPAPCLGVIPWLTDEDQQADCGQYLTLPGESGHG